MSAVFGKLQGQTLELQNGLNIIEAPNETGKSSWCAFLLSMLYGINSRERDKSGSIADKNRYAPWTGAAMSGRMNLSTEGHDITITRTTRRPTAPMGEFQALYSGTGNAVSDLSAATCGEELLGVSRDVYARSAFIRQNSLPITQSSELERRIAALLSSGEERVSYSEAADALKKQLNRRRHNKTGQIPALEAELQQLCAQIDEAEALSQRIVLLRGQEQQLTEQEALLRQEWEHCAAWNRQQDALRLSPAAEAADRALRYADELRRQLEADRIPENDTISRLRGAIVNLTTARQHLVRAREARDEAMHVFLRADEAAGRSPFAGQTAEQAQQEAAAPPKGKPRYAPAILGGLAAAAVVAVTAYAAYFYWHPHPAILYAGLPLIPVSGATVGALLCRKARKTAQTAALTKRFGTADRNQITALADTYLRLAQARDEAQANLDRLSAEADTLYNSIVSNEQAILLEIRRFAPAANDTSAADALLRGCAIRRKELAAAEAAAREALQEQDNAAAALAAQANTLAPPARSEAEISAERNQVSAALAACRETMQHLAGQLSAVGDAAQLRANAEGVQQQLETLQAQYDALQLAAEAMASANQALQNRFAPALGRRTAQLFHQLTDGRYRNVVLDRELHLSAEPEGDHLYRDIALLSAGAADQLYLAARLAICESVLPAEKNAPIVLDDALANFDDARCIAALRLLKEEARHRQILLFTCHGREAAYFADDPDVTIIRLTNDGEKV